MKDQKTKCIIEIETLTVKCWYIITSIKKGVPLYLFGVLW